MVPDNLRKVLSLGDWTVLEDWGGIAEALQRSDMQDNAAGESESDLETRTSSDEEKDHDRSV